MQDLIDKGHKQALALFQNQQYDLARELLTQALRTFPEDDGFVGLLGMVENQTGHHKTAETLFRLALQLNPETPEHINNLALAMESQGEKNKASNLYARALDIDPNFTPARSNLAMFLHKQGMDDEALVELGKATTIDPEAAYAWFAKGIILGDQKRIVESVEAHRRATALDEKNPAHQFNLACGLLLLGKWAEGFQHFRHRWGLFPQFEFKRNALSAHKPEWQGEDLQGKAIYVWCCQGDGDKIQLARYLQHLKNQGAAVVLESPDSLLTLVESIKGIYKTAPPQVNYVCRKDAPQIPIRFTLDHSTLPAFDYHVEMMDLPRLLNVTPENTSGKPYITVEAKLENLGKNINIGIVWAGSPIHQNDHRRSCPLKHFAPLAQLPNVKLFSLQKDTRVRHYPDIGRVDLTEGAAFPITDLAEHLTDWRETARVINSLDVVITVDTAVAHLAGAIGKPTVILLPYIADWRWGLEANTTPWYDSVTLARQPAEGDWESAIDKAMQFLTFPFRLR